MKFLILFLFITSCSSIKCFSLDGKASSSCERKEAAKEFCKEDGLVVDDYHYGWVKCK